MRPQLNPRLFHWIFDRYSKLVYWYFTDKMGFTGDEAQDLTQETFLKVHSGLPNFEGRANLKNWILSIAKNIGLNAIRSRGSEKRNKLEVSIEEDGNRSLTERIACRAAEDPMRRLLAREKLEALSKAIDELPPQMRKCMLLRFGQDLRYKEIANVLKISVETVKAQLHQARKKLDRSIGSYFSYDGRANDER